MRPATAESSTIAECGTALATAVASTLWFFRALFHERFDAVPGDLGDGRLLNFLLEHLWQWLRRSPLHRDLWTLPIFYPGGAGSFAWSDLLLSFAPPYWLARAAGAGPYGAYQLWFLAIGVSNCLAAYLLVRWGLRASRAAAVLSAPLACFSASRLYQIQHAQLWPLFYPLLGACAVLLYLRAVAPLTRRLALAGAAAAVVLQLYGAIYYGAFMLLLGGILLAAMLRTPAPRVALLLRARNDRRAILLTGFAAALALAPLVVMYLGVQSAVGSRRWREVAELSPRPATWLYFPPTAPLSSWTSRSPLFSDLPHADEQAMGLGYVTVALTVAGLILGRRRPALRIAAISMLIAMAAITLYPGGFALWLLVVRALPALAAVRAISRLGLFLPILAAAAIAALVDGVSPRKRPWIIALALIAVAEQSVRLTTFDKRDATEPVSELASRVDPSAKAFFVSTRRRDLSPWMIHLDAMWATLETGRPTVNGYTGNRPRDWGEQLWLARSGTVKRDQRLQADMERWLGLYGVRPDEVQRIEIGRGYRRGPAVREP